MIPVIAFVGVTCVIGIAFLIAASFARWRPPNAGWRAALYSAGFGMVVLGGLSPAKGGTPAMLMLVIAA